MRQVPAYGAREHYPLQVAPFLDEILQLVTVRDAHDILFDDGSFVQFFGHIVAGSSNQLHASIKGSVIRTRTHKGGQEGMMDIDDAAGISLQKPWREYLHVARQHHEIDAVILQ